MLNDKNIKLISTHTLFHQVNYCLHLHTEPILYCCHTSKWSTIKKTKVAKKKYIYAINILSCPKKIRLMTQFAHFYEFFYDHGLFDALWDANYGVVCTTCFMSFCAFLFVYFLLSRIFNVF